MFARAFNKGSVGKLAVSRTGGSWGARGRSAAGCHILHLRRAMRHALFCALVRNACLVSVFRSGEYILESRASGCALTAGNYFDARMLAANASVIARGECFDLRSRLQEARHLRQSLTLERLQAGGCCRGAAAWRVQPGSGGHAGNALQIERELHTPSSFCNGGNPAASTTGDCPALVWQAQPRWRQESGGGAAATCC